MSRPPSWGCGYFAVWKSLFLPQSSQTSACIAADYFQSSGSTCRAEKVLVFCGKGLDFGGHKGKWVDDITGFHRLIGHTENDIFKHISWLFSLIFVFLTWLPWLFSLVFSRQQLTTGISYLQLVSPLEISGVYFACISKLEQTLNNKCNDFSEESTLNMHMICFPFYSKSRFMYSSILLSYLPTLIIDIYDWQILT